MMGVIIKYRGATPKIAKRKLPRILKEAFRLTLSFWHKSMRPKHFTKAGATEYGYDKRSGERGSGRAFKGSYTQKKLRKFGHTKPLVYTGESMNLSRIRDVRSTSKGGRVVMRVPTFNRRPKGKKRSMREEMTQVSVKERNQLVRIFERAVDAQIKRVRDTETVRIN